MRIGHSITRMHVPIIKIPVRVRDVMMQHLCLRSREFQDRSDNYNARACDRDPVERDCTSTEQGV